MPISLSRLTLKSTFFPGLNVRLAALPQLARITEEQLEIARQLAIHRIRIEHIESAAQLHPDDQEFELKDLEDQVTHLIPKLLRGGFILTLWSVFERSLKDIVIRAGEFTNRPIADDFFRHNEFFRGVEIGMQSRAKVPAFPETSVFKRLKLLASVRQALIHHDGRRSETHTNLLSLQPIELEAIGIILEHDYSFVEIQDEIKRRNTDDNNVETDAD